VRATVIKTTQLELSFTNQEIKLSGGF
jgi:hypothetical protein